MYILEGFIFVFIITTGIIVGAAIGCWLSEKSDCGDDLFPIFFGFGILFGGLLSFLIRDHIKSFSKSLAKNLIDLLIGNVQFLATYWLPILGVCAFVASVIYAAMHQDEMKMLYAAIKRLYSAAVSHIKMSDHAIMRYAAKQTKKLIAIAPDIEWHDIRTSISEIGTIHIVGLLHERKGLRAAIKRIRGVLKQVEWQKPDRGDIEKANARRSAQTVEMLVVKLQKNEKDITEALDMLQHLEADLAAATVDEYRRDEIKAKLRGLVSRIQQNSAEVQVARTESDDYAQGRIRRLTE